MFAEELWCIFASGGWAKGNSYIKFPVLTVPEFKYRWTCHFTVKEQYRFKPNILGFLWLGFNKYCRQICYMGFPSSKSTQRFDSQKADQPNYGQPLWSWDPAYVFQSFSNFWYRQHGMDLPVFLEIFLMSQGCSSFISFWKRSNKIVLLSPRLSLPLITHIHFWQLHQLHTATILQHHWQLLI